MPLFKSINQYFDFSQDAKDLLKQNSQFSLSHKSFPLQYLHHFPSLTLTLNDLNLNGSKPFKDKYVDFCVAGKEYEGKTGYTNYDLWLPKAEGKKYAIVQEDSDSVIRFDETKHVKKLEVKEVKSFGDDDDVFNKPKTSSDFSLD